MLRADRDFTQQEELRLHSDAERRALAIGWVRRIIAVFAQEACDLARMGAPEWSLSRIEPRVGEVLRLLALEAEDSKFVGGNKPDLTDGQGHLREQARAEIARSSEWSAYQEELLDLMNASGRNHRDKPGLADPGQFSEKVIPAKSQEQDDGSISARGVVEFRKCLLAQYKFATNNPANKKIYEAYNSCIHKPQFYAWLKGELSSESATTINFERFLRDKKPPLPSRPQK